MSKILTTQLTGALQRIQKTEEEAIEETARLLAQATIGEGTIYFACFDEMEGIIQNALSAVEPMANVQRWSEELQVTEADRVCIFTRHTANPIAFKLAQRLAANFIPFSVIASESYSEENELCTLAYTYISYKLKSGILPHPTNLGERIVTPHLLLALFVYESIKLHYDELLDDLEES